MLPVFQAIPFDTAGLVSSGHWGLHGAFFEAFCHSDESAMDVIDDAALLLEFLWQG
jgi:hypothetical protein